MEPLVVDDDDNAAVPWIKDGGRNRWRYKAGSAELIIEIELTQNKVAEIDAHRLVEVQKRKWCAVGYKKNLNLWYSTTKFEGRQLSMHTFCSRRYLPRLIILMEMACVMCMRTFETDAMV